MQEAEHVAVRLRAQFARKCRHRRIDFGQRSRTQKQARRKALVGAAQHAAGVMGFDQAIDRDDEIGRRPLRQHMRDVAEGILVDIETRVAGDVDLPLGNVLPVMAARRHPQDLNDTACWRIVVIAGGMGNSQAHGMSKLSSPSFRGDAKHRTRNLEIPGLALTRHPGMTVFDQIKYCLVMISPSRELSSMNSWMNSCTPCWKISSIWLCSSRLRTPRAWRCAGPWRP